MDPETASAATDRGQRSEGGMGALKRTTGRDRAEWFGVLDDWGAAGRPYREIADWLTGTRGLSAWWAQKLIVEYEQERGLRRPGVRPGGSFEIGASKTINVAPAAAREAFVELARSECWLPRAAMSMVASAPEGPLRLEADGGSRLQVEFLARGPKKTLVVLHHLRLRDADGAARAKAQWRERLTVLKDGLEGR
jgi:hypothetical protein